MNVSVYGKGPVLTVTKYIFLKLSLKLFSWGLPGRKNDTIYDWMTSMTLQEVNTSCWGEMRWDEMRWERVVEGGESILKRNENVGRDVEFQKQEKERDEWESLLGLEGT